MSLREVVEYAQTHFAGPSAVPGDLEAEDPSTGAHADLNQRLAGRSPSGRPPFPDWLRQRDSDRRLPITPEYHWHIEGPIDPLHQPHDMDSVNPDALAFYLPFHFYRQDWGIYIRTRGVLDLARYLRNDRLIPGDEKYLTFAEQILYEHELCHATVEVACSRAEMVSRSGLYHPYYGIPEAAEHEEALSNAHCLTKARALLEDLPLEEATLRRLEAWMNSQGRGYRDFPRWSKPRALIRGRDRAARFMLQMLPPPHPKLSGPPHDFTFRGTRLYRFPVTRIDDLADNMGTSILRPFPKRDGIQVFVYARDHNPPHIHIRVLGTPEMTRYLWPQLVPYQNDRALPRSKRRSLDAYVAEHREEIQKRIERYARARSIS